MRRLKGTRYQASAEFTRFLEEDLLELSFVDALKFYETAVPYTSATELALLGCNDRFFLLSALMNRPDVVHPWLYDRCREVELDPDNHLDLWAREHYKSTIITFAGVIQEALADPETTIGIFSHTANIARKFLGQIMRELESNTTLHELYRDALYENPKKDSPRWALDGGLILKRKMNPKEATIEAWGLVDGQPTGKHFNILVYDDVVTRESVTNPEMVKKTTEAWELSDNLGAGSVRKWHIGTRYSFGDSYGLILERGILKPRIYPATDNGKMDGVPVFMDRARWEEKKKTQRSTLAAQMLQNPLAGAEQTFRAEWLRCWYVRPQTMTIYIMVDPSKGRSATSDRTAIAVIAIDSAGNKYFLDGYRHRMSLSERWHAVKTLYQKWSKERGVQHLAVGYERYGQATDDEYFQERMELEGWGFPIEELSWTRDGTKSKKDRVERLEPDVRLSRFYLPAVIHEPGIGDCYWDIDKAKGHVIKKPVRGPSREMEIMRKTGQDHRVCQSIKRKDEDGRIYDVTNALMEEMLFFPFAPKDDLVDATSRIYDMQPVAPAIYEHTAAAMPINDFLDA